MIPHLDDKLREHAAAVARELRRRAKHGLLDGRDTPQMHKYKRHCTNDDGATRMRLIFTRDTGHHSSGWMRNPDYERCWHLSMSPLPALIVIPGAAQLAEFDPKTRRLWVEAFFGEDIRLVWHEPAASALGKRIGVEHYRVFCDEHWQPILPRGEVYSSELTELGWRSASQVLEEDGRRIESTLDPT